MLEENLKIIKFYQQREYIYIERITENKKQMNKRRDKLM